MKKRLSRWFGLGDLHLTPDRNISSPLTGTGPVQIGSSKKVRIRLSTISKTERPQQRRSLVKRSPSRAIRVCLAVPSFSMLVTICKAAYLFSSFFCFASNFSPSLTNGLYIQLKNNWKK